MFGKFGCFISWFGMTEEFIQCIFVFLCFSCWLASVEVTRTNGLWLTLTRKGHPDSSCRSEVWFELYNMREEGNVNFGGK